MTEDEGQLEAFFAAARSCPPEPNPRLEAAIVAAAAPAPFLSRRIAAGLGATLLVGIALGAAASEDWAGADGWAPLDAAEFDPEAFVLALEEG